MGAVGRRAVPLREGRACEFGADDGVLRPLGRVASSARPAPKLPVMPEACLQHDEGQARALCNVTCAGRRVGFRPFMRFPLSLSQMSKFWSRRRRSELLGRVTKWHGPRLTFPPGRRIRALPRSGPGLVLWEGAAKADCCDGALGLTSVALQHRQIKHPIPQQTARFPEYTESAARVSCPSDVRPDRRSRRARPRRWSRGSISASWGPWWFP